MKCATCRKLTDELDSPWDRIRLFFFHFFHNDIVDLSQDKFTQGFADGYKVGLLQGREEAKETTDELLKQMAEPTPYDQCKQFPVLVDMEKILTSNKQGQVFLNGVQIESKKLEQLKGEVIMLSNSLLWDIIVNTLEHQAQEIGWMKSKEIQDLMNAKMISYTVDVQRKILQKIEKA